MKLKPVRFAPQEDGKCICGFDPVNILPNSAGRFFCPQSGHEWVEDKPEEVGAGPEAGAGGPAEEAGDAGTGGPATEAGDGEAGGAAEEAGQAAAATGGTEEEEEPGGAPLS